MRRTGYENQENRIGRTRGNGAENFAGNDLKTGKKNDLKTVKKRSKKRSKKGVKKQSKKTFKTAPKSGIKISPKFADFYRSQKFGFSQFYHNMKGVLRKLPETLCEIIVLIL